MKRRIRLSKSNNWKYTWRMLLASHEWHIVEDDVPEGYIVSVDKSGNSYSVTNTYPTVEGEVRPSANPRVTITPVPGESAAPEDPNETPYAGEPTPSVGSNPGSTENPGSGTSGRHPGASAAPGGIEPGNDPITGNPPDTQSGNPPVPNENGGYDGNPNVPSVPGSISENTAGTASPAVPAEVSGNGGSGGSTQKLPQTGQLWWPVPIAAALGMALFILGYGLIRKAEEDE